MNKRERIETLIYNSTATDFIPAAFFLHFDPAYHQGQAAIDKHLEYFTFTGMDFVKVQYEQILLPLAVSKPEDWANVPLYPPDFFEEPVRVIEGLVKAIQREAMVVVTVYSPFMQAARLADAGVFETHFKHNPAAVAKGLATMTENVLNLLRGCKRVGVDGFYVSTQGGETLRFPGTDIFQRYIKPSDLTVWNEIQDCAFNILHVCDYWGGYSDLTPYPDYPGHVVNASLHVGDTVLTPTDVSKMFGRPFMGGMERKGIIATGSATEIQRATQDILAQASERFILGADCTVPSETPWKNLKTAIDTAHAYVRG